MLAIKYARESKVPFLGICLGFQLAIVEWARNVLEIHGGVNLSNLLVFIYLICCRCHFGRVRP